MAFDNSLFIAAHPELAEEVARKHGGLDWIKKYTNEEGGRITEYWERNSDGVLVDVTERELAREELEKAKEELEKLRLQGGEL